MAAIGLVPMFQQYVQGEFEIEVTGLFHCGPNHESPKRFRYEVTLHYPGDALDEAGFLQDNLMFRAVTGAYFKGLTETKLSCELLCRKNARDLCDLAPETCKGVKVAIWPIDNSVKVEYTHPKD